jgi:4a-hydroxytetrahydrobiopterin dehydratase
MRRRGSGCDILIHDNQPARGSLANRAKVESMKLSEDDLKQELLALPEWTVKNGKLHRQYKFPDFTLAFGFMTMSAIVIEKMNHHPEWLNVYSRVTVNLVSHDENGITTRDILLAKTLEGIAQKLI